MNTVGLNMICWSKQSGLEYKKASTVGLNMIESSTVGLNINVANTVGSNIDKASTEWLNQHSRLKYK